MISRERNTPKPKPPIKRTIERRYMTLNIQNSYSGWQFPWIVVHTSIKWKQICTGLNQTQTQLLQQHHMSDPNTNFSFYLTLDPHYH